MPAKKIIDAVTSTFAVMGSSMATATAGPIPGSTPTAVPSTQPTRAHNRFAGEIAVANPCISALRISISEPPGFGQARQVDRQEFGECPEHRARDQETRESVYRQHSHRARVLPARAPQAL